MVVTWAGRGARCCVFFDGTIVNRRQATRSRQTLVGVFARKTGGALLL
jgi:hypothetical protein